MKVTVLLVESDAPLKESLSKVLRSEEFNVRTAASGEQALRSLKDDHIDLVLMDVDTPDEDGWQDARQLATSQMFLPLVLLTAKSGQQHRAALAGADALLEKPFSFPDLLQTIRELLAQTLEGRLFRLEEAYSAAGG